MNKHKKSKKSEWLLNPKYCEMNHQRKYYFDPRYYLRHQIIYHKIRISKAVARARFPSELYEFILATNEMIDTKDFLADMIFISPNVVNIVDRMVYVI